MRISIEKKSKSTFWYFCYFKLCHISQKRGF